ncbi:hypothetical protein ACIPW9_35970 [Streptomyces sp. NPDC090052]|uniref:hypothetical protein n=1 Tax=Streptomyces sp. NPDC090052 TaxID=3365931 RepID=UPI0038279DD4
MPPKKKPTPQAAARAALPTADEAIAFLAEQGKQPMADAVTALADYARSSGFDANPVSGTTVSLYGPKDLLDRARKASTAGLSTDVAEGFQKFLDGTWEPKQPSSWGTEGEKITTSTRVPEDLIKKVKTAAVEFATARDWDMRRGYALTAQHIALQWLEHLYPAPKTKTAAGRKPAAE